LEAYKIWTKHGEEGENVAGVNREGVVNEETGVNRPKVVDDVSRNTLANDTMKDGISKMLRDAEPGFLSPRHFGKTGENEKGCKGTLYLGCKMSKLKANLMLLDLKSTHGLSDKGFEDMLYVLEKLLPSPNVLPRTTYKAKQRSAHSASKLKKSIRVPMNAYYTMEMNIKTWTHAQSAQLHCKSMARQAMMVVGSKKALKRLLGIFLYFLTWRGCLRVQR
jgi:hypothetical protein